MKNMDLVTSLGNLTLDNSHDILPDSLPFLSSTHCPFSRAQLNGVDDFLHRLFDARSEGFNDEIWVKSRDATLSRPQRTTNILERSDKTSVAAMLSRHLWWEGENDEEDNLVSWTSSFLFVLQYAFYRKRYHGTDFKTMFICTVDTRQLPADVYVRDMDLINAHSPLNSRLSDLQRIRLGPHYFGEFLSQGALRIEGHCSIVSMQDILDAGLFRLRPEFEGFETRPPTWANEVVRLRRTDASADEITRLDCGHVEIAEHIGHLFGARFKWPVVLACLALKPWDELETHLMDALTQPAFAGQYNLNVISAGANQCSRDQTARNLIVKDQSGSVCGLAGGSARGRDSANHFDQSPAGQGP